MLGFLKWHDRPRPVIYEKRIATMSKLKKELQTLDGDAGVRVESGSKERKLFVFITRFNDTYTAVLCPAEGAGWRTPGKPIQSKEFRNVKETVGYLKTVTRRNVRAFAY
jgi:hypothetical protein